MNLYAVRLRTAANILPISYQVADTGLAAIAGAMAETYEATIGATVRRALVNEWDCNNFTISGHVPHL
jgi:hypothetical protein